MKYSIFTILSFLIVPTVAMAGGSEGFVPLVGIPGLSNEQAPTFDSYIDALYALAISVAALIAVIQIVIGGAQYMMDDLITSKSAAKERIKNALIGLLIIIAAALILTTINSDLTRLEISAPVIEVDNNRPDPINTYIESCAEASDNGSTSCINIGCREIEIRAEMQMGTDVVESGDVTCRQVCNTVYQGTIIDTWVRNECYTLQELADQCDPQQSSECCIMVQGSQGDAGTSWDNSRPNGQRCTGLEAAQEYRMEKCYKDRQTWDETNNTCRPIACNRTTNQSCCELGYPDSNWENGQCVVAGLGQDIAEGECSSNEIYDFVADSCVPLDENNFDYYPLSSSVIANGNPVEVCEGLAGNYTYNPNIQMCVQPR